MIEEKALKAKEATSTLLTFIKSCEGPYDERIMDSLNDFLSATADFKSCIENQSSQEGDVVGPNALAFLEEKITKTEKEIQYLIEEKFSLLLQLEEQIKIVDSKITLCNSIKDCGDIEKLLAFIQRTSPYYSCSKGWKPGESMGASKPPYPTEEMMRSSSLFQRSIKKQPLVKPGNPEEAQPHIKTNLSHGPKEDTGELIDLDLNPDLL
jgi:hypothetical protein